MIPYEYMYGSYRNRKFTDIWGDVESFAADYDDSPFNTASEGLTTDKVELIYYLLYAKYGNSTIASFDEFQFKMGVFSLIFTHAPTWVKRLEIQQELRNLTPSQLQTGSKTILNQASNPGTPPATASLEELTYINLQNTATTKRPIIEGYAMLAGLLEKDVTTEFINRFKPLFLRVLQPETPLWFETTEPNIAITED